MIRLPVDEKKSEFGALFLNKDTQILLIMGDTGSGKSTRIPWLCWQKTLVNPSRDSGIVACTQPRRVAAKSVAQRVARELRYTLGNEVGYAFRFEENFNNKTVIKFCTDGLLLQEAVRDSKLEKYSVIIIDEAHERTASSDLLMGLLKNVAKRRPNLKIVIMSATLNAEKFQHYFDCPMLHIPGRTHAVEIMHTNAPLEGKFVDVAVLQVLQIHETDNIKEGRDILLFLPGQKEIDRAYYQIANQIRNLHINDLICVKLYGALPIDVQEEVFRKTQPKTRKCVLATNVAEASITIDGIVYVIDTGFFNQKVYNAETGVESLLPVLISKASAKQRAGRAGRTQAGKCYRLYTQKAYDIEMRDETEPEIRREDLTGTVLKMKKLGIMDPVKFDFLDPPTPEALKNALKMLFQLKALDGKGRLTELGEKISWFPVEPQLATALIKSAELKCAGEMLTIVAMLSTQHHCFLNVDKEQQPAVKEARSDVKHADGDHYTLVNIFHSLQPITNMNARREWCSRRGINNKVIMEAERIREQLERIMVNKKLSVAWGNVNTKMDDIAQALCAGFFMQVAKREIGNNFTTIKRSQPVLLDKNSTFVHPNKWALFHKLLETKNHIIMKTVTGVKPEWLPDVAPRFTSS